MKKLAVLLLFPVLSVNAHAGRIKLSKECKRTLDRALDHAHEQRKVAIQFGSRGNLREADAILAEAIDTCVEIALTERNYSDRKKARISARISAMAEQYLEDRG